MLPTADVAIPKVGMDSEKKAPKAKRDNSSATLLGEIEVTWLSRKYVVFKINRIVGMCTIGHKETSLLS